MKLDEAIKVLEDEAKDADANGLLLEAGAFRLGIEALKAIAFWNEKQLPQHQIHLPGETEE